jgi:flagellar biosynthetic protein FliP
MAAVAAAAALLVPAASAAQTPPAAPPAPEAASPAKADEAKTSSSSLPGLDQVIDAVNKATAGKEQDRSARDWSSPVKLALVFAGLAVLPSILVMMTSFTRIVIVLALVRRALTTQNIPPTIAVVGLSLFLTVFTMAPTFGRINQDALQPYLKDRIAFDAAVGRGTDRLKEFVLSQTRQSDLSLFMEMASLDRAVETIDDVPLHVAIPAFAISEFRTAFEMGCLLFIPFLLIDIVIGSILLSTGMMMLPPSMISLPFKLILFVLVDGWHMLARTLVMSFQ